MRRAMGHRADASGGVSVSGSTVTPADEGHVDAPVGPPDNAVEAARLAVLRSYEPAALVGGVAFDRLTALAADLAGTAMGLVSLVDEHTQRYLSTVGIAPPALRRDEGFCGYELAAGTVLVVPDARADPRFADLPVVTGAPWIRFYAGVPLIAPEGHVLGRLCVLDREPGSLTPRQLGHLQTIADEVMAQLTLGRQSVELAAEVESRRLSQATLADQQHLLTAVLADPGTVIYAMDLEGRFLMANATTHRMTRQPPGSMVGKHYADVLPADIAAAHSRVDAEVVRDGTSVVADELFPRARGRSRIFRVGRFPLRHTDGSVYGVAVSGVDVTEQRAAEVALRESEQRWRQLFVGSPVGIGLLDAEGVFRAVNDALCALFDRPTDDLLGHRPQEFAATDEPLVPAPGVAAATVESRLLLPDGRSRWAWVTTAPTPGPDEQTWTLAYLQDITERLASQQAVQDSEANLTAVAEVIQLIQSGGDARQTIVDAGRDLAHAQFACLLEPAPHGRSLVVTSSTDSAMLGVELPLDGTSAGVEAFLTGTTVFVPDTRFGPHSSPRLVELAGDGTSFCAVPVRSGDRTTAAMSVGWSQRLERMNDRRVQVVSLLADQAGVALRQVALLDELEQLAQTDALTTLPNRRSWDRTLDTLLSMSAATGHPLSVALVDLDHFKAFNDTYGHAAGDEFLREFADRAHAVLRSADTVARWGGEEFAVALPDCQGPVAAEVLERIRLGVPTGQTCSIGYGTWDGQETAADLMERVDAALYAAKRAGRDRIQLAAPRPPR